MEVLNLKYLTKKQVFIEIFHFFRIKYPEGKKCVNYVILLGIIKVEKLPSADSGMPSTGCLSGASVVITPRLTAFNSGEVVDNAHLMRYIWKL